ncbi:phosphohistidine phosphatase SixA [candidate division GN15 bacterium]|nr:phosphohistidine phosphatase SixA [candidate division GN15 bacterium]
MKLYLVQHGLAMAKDQDPDRPLTESGANETQKVAQHLAHSRHPNPADIVHSGKTRARQTAEIFADMLGITNRVEQSDALSPNDDPEVIRRQLAETDKDVMLVGHMPHVSRLASLLLTGDPDQPVIAFRNSGVVCLVEDQEGGWKLNWMLVPELVL